MDFLAEMCNAKHNSAGNYIKQQSDFAHVGERMLQEWEKGVALSLRPFAAT
jgi:hypothetical protein